MAWRNYNKYGNKKVTVAGETFESKHEADRWIQLKVLQNFGRIQNLQRQVKFVLIPAQYEETGEIIRKGKNKGKPKPGKLIEREVAYYADFVYFDDNGLVVEDAKGMKTKDYIIKRKLMLWIHGIRIKEV